MRIGASYSHLNGYEWIMAHDPAIWAEVKEAIARVDARRHRKKNREEEAVGTTRPYSTTELRKAFARELHSCGWGDGRTGCWGTDDYRVTRRAVSLPLDQQRLEIKAAGRNPFFFQHDIEFVKRRVAIVARFGERNSVAYDLFVNHLAFFVNGAISVGIEMLPMREMQTEISGGTACYEEALFDMACQDGGVPPVPLMLVGLLPQRCPCIGQQAGME